MGYYTFGFYQVTTLPTWCHGRYFVSSWSRELFLIVVRCFPVLIKENNGPKTQAWTVYRECSLQTEQIGCEYFLKSQKSLSSTVFNDITLIYCFAVAKHLA